jgi:hypothetical protein
MLVHANGQPSTLTHTQHPTLPQTPAPSQPPNHTNKHPSSPTETENTAPAHTHTRTHAHTHARMHAHAPHTQASPFQERCAESERAAQRAQAAAADACHQVAASQAEGSSLRQLLASSEADRAALQVSIIIIMMMVMMMMMMMMMMIMIEMKDITGLESHVTQLLLLSWPHGIHPPTQLNPPNLAGEVALSSAACACFGVRGTFPASSCI